MLRNEALSLLNEIVTTYPELLDSCTHMSLNLQEGDTRLIIKSAFDFEQRNALMGIIKGKGFKVVECSRDVWLIY